MSQPGKKQKHLVLGILAHVDAGKTTLSEGILYKTGAIRKAGRVDHGDAFLDTDAMEKKRGITIFSKQARFPLGEMDVTLLDTPGHVDFSPEMERTISVMDAAILVVSAPQGVTGHLRTLFLLLANAGVPTFVFVNKMDQEGADRAKSLSELAEVFGEGCIDFSEDLTSDAKQEQLAVTDEAVLASYLEGEAVTEDTIRALIGKRAVIPVCFGSALRMEGIEELLSCIAKYASPPDYPERFGARVFKITRDPQGMRLSHIKITGGTLRVKELLGSADDAEKIDQIRLYSGTQYELTGEAEAGMICAVTGPSSTRAGMGFGFEEAQALPLLSPVMNSAVILPEGADRAAVLAALRTLEEEEPSLHVGYDEEAGEITLGIMGEVQIEILREIMEARFGQTISFGQGRIVYMETIGNTVEGVGHFEPLRHYAEVHLLLEPGIPGSGLVFESDCSTDLLAKNWQRLVLTHLAERVHRGVLVGAAITDMKITLIGGRAHEKHTEGGDFRQATYRAVRQGLMMAENILLEPVYRFQIDLPSDAIGRAMTDMEQRGAKIEPPETDGDSARLLGTVPASTMQDYARILASYTGGRGQLSLSLSGYAPCHDAEAVIEAAAYDPDADPAYPVSSVFCSHGAGVIIPWDEVRAHMHVDTGWREGYAYREGKWLMQDAPEFAGAGSAESSDQYDAEGLRAEALRKKREALRELSFEERSARQQAGEAELKEIFERTYGEVRNTQGQHSATLHRFDVGEQDSSSSVGSSGSHAAQGEALYDQAWREYQKSGAKASGGRAAGTKASGGRRESDKQREVREAWLDSHGKKQALDKAEQYLLVDGYNIIFAWEELRALAKQNIDSARDELMDILSDYQGTTGEELILVFDAYKVKGGTGSTLRYHNIHVVYTREAETADAYIEKTVHRLGKNRRVRVATSDGLEQMIILGAGAVRVSAGELFAEVTNARRTLREEHINTQKRSAMQHLLDSVDLDQT